MTLFESTNDFGDHITEVTHTANARASFPMLSEMIVERGTQADWDGGLSALHYKAHSLPIGASYWRLVFRGETIGVAIMGMARPLLKERHAIFPKFTPGIDSQVSNIHRYAIINDDFRVVGRFVVDTMFRSAGVAYRFLNLASRLHGFKYMEIQSSMSKFSRFTQRAGFMMVKPIRSPAYEKGLKFMRTWFEAHPNDMEAIIEELHGMPKAEQKLVEIKLRDFYFSNSPLEKTGGRRFYTQSAMDGWDARRFISKIQGLCFSSPLYGVYANPDYGRELPISLPLLAFDRQRTDEPLLLV